jgi:hypothetical protein
LDPQPESFLVPNARLDVFVSIFQLLGAPIVVAFGLRSPTIYILTPLSPLPPLEMILISEKKS